MPSAQSSSGARWLGPSLFAAVALLAIGVLALTQELRSRPDVINTICVDRAECPGGKIRFHLSKDEAKATIAIVDRHGAVVAEPIFEQALAAGVVRAEWDGTVDPGGKPADPGRYRVRFTLDELGRRAFMPGKIGIEAES